MLLGPYNLVSLTNYFPQSFNYGEEKETNEEGNGNSFQYSCLKIPWTEEPGGL